jgi:hypothetical protein
MRVCKRTEVEAALVRKGFLLDPDRDHKFYSFIRDGKCVARTKVSHGSKHRDLTRELLSCMARQCHLTNSDFLQLIECTMSQQQYETELRRQGFIN